MRILQWSVVVAALACIGLATNRAEAAYFSGSSADITDFAGGSEVSTAGTFIEAVNVLNHTISGIGVSTTINGVLFKDTYPGAYHEAGESFANASFVWNGRGEGYADGNLWSTGGAYDTLADSQMFNVDNGNTNSGDGYGVVNLTPGVLYELQVFMLDDRGSQDKTFPLQFQQVSWTGNGDQQNGGVPGVEIGYLSGITIGGAGVTQSNGEIATVRFKIDPGYNGATVNTWSGGAINGLQLRQIAVPEPSALVLVGLALLGFAGASGRVR